MTVNAIKGAIAELVWFDGETNTFKGDRFTLNMLRLLPTRPEVGTAGTSGQIAPLSQNNSQSSECVGPDFGTTEIGTKAVGTRITASQIIIWAMLTFGTLALIARLPDILDARSYTAIPVSS